MDDVGTLLTNCETRPQITLGVTRGAWRLLAALGVAAAPEVCLPNGRRADLMGLGPKGQIVIVEVKSGPEDFKADFKWQEYRPYCDQFYFAVAPEFPQSLLPEEPGLIVADGFGGAVVREAAPAPLVPARRKALTLAFGRLTAMRAATLHI
jgi:hypothetical protein